MDLRSGWNLRHRLLQRGIGAVWMNGQKVVLGTGEALLAPGSNPVRATDPCFIDAHEGEEEPC
jgi:hypothetical protein